LADSADFVIVGGGIAGLVLARRLILGGRSVIVLESSDHLGGTVARHTVGGIELDAGAESFATRGNTVRDLAIALKLDDDIVEPNPQGAWLQTVAGKAHPLPKNSLLGIPGSPLAGDVAAIIGWRAALRAYSEGFLPGNVGSKAQFLGELVRARMGPVVLDQLVRPIARGVHSTDADELPIDQVAPGLRGAIARNGSLARAVIELRASSERAGSAVAGIRGGIFRLVDRLAADLDRFGVEVRLGERVTDVGQRFARTSHGAVSGTVVVAASGVATSAAAPTRVVLATLVVDQPLLDVAPRGTGLLVAAGAPGIAAKALTNSTAKWEWLAEAAAGKHVLRLSYDGEPRNLAEIARMDAATLLGVALPPSAVLDFAKVAWYRPVRVNATTHAVPLVGESIAGTGLASVVARSQALAEDLL
jgi:oxygen-dependent protoporphyrinogen oxidase